MRDYEDKEKMPEDTLSSQNNKDKNFAADTSAVFK